MCAAKKSWSYRSWSLQGIVQCHPAPYKHGTPYEPLSKLLILPLIMVPYMVPTYAPFKEFRL